MTSFILYDWMTWGSLLKMVLLLVILTLAHHYFFIVSKPEKETKLIHQIKFGICLIILFIFFLGVVLSMCLVLSSWFSHYYPSLMTWLTYNYYVFKSWAASYYFGEITQEPPNPRYLEHLKELEEFFQKPSGPGRMQMAYTQMVIARDYLGGFTMPPRINATFEEKEIIYRWVETYLNNFYNTFYEFRYKEKMLDPQNEYLINLLKYWDLFMPYEHRKFYF